MRLNILKVAALVLGLGFAASAYAIPAIPVPPSVIPAIPVPPSAIPAIPVPPAAIPAIPVPPR